MQFTILPEGRQLVFIGCSKADCIVLLYIEERNKNAMNIKEYLTKHRLLADGAFGTYYMQTGGKQQTVERANLENPKAVEKLHMEYLKAGARLIRTNTFSANSAVLGGERTWRREVIQAGYSCARRAVETFCMTNEGEKEEVFIAASIGPVPENLAEEEQEILEEYRFICDSLLECNAEIFCFETCADFKYVLSAAEYVKERTDGRAFIMVNFCLNRYGYTKSGISAARLVEAADQSAAVDAVGFNCGIGIGHMLQILKEMKPFTDKFLSIMPNSSYPERMQDRAVYLDNAQYFAGMMEEIARLGIDILGGCCGTSPEYIRLTGEKIDFASPAKKKKAEKERLQSGEPDYSVNRFCRKLKEGKKVIAVELDPPYDAEIHGIMDRANILKAAGVDMLTFADSPMARPRMDSVLTSVKVQNEVGIPVMPHISCRDKNMIAMRAQLLGAYVNGIRNLLIVTGDPVPGSERGTVSSVFDFNSVRLMEFVKEINREHFPEEPLCYGGAINYARANIDVEVKRILKKAEAGANYFLTQPIYSDGDIERIAYIKSKADIKILCGIMPLVNYKNANFIANEMTGIHVPKEVIEAFSPEMTRKEAEDTGVGIARKVIKKLEPVADGYYFILPFNRVHLVKACLEAE